MRAGILLVLALTAASCASSTPSAELPDVTSTEVVESTTSTSSSTTTEPATTTSSSSTTTSTTTTTTLPPTTTTSTTSTTTTTTSTTTTTTTIPAPVDLSTPTSGDTFRNTETNLPFVVVQSTYWNVGRVRARAGVGPFGTFQDPVAEAWIYSDFVAQRPAATLRTTVSWHGSLLTLASFGSGTTVEVDLGIYEVNNGTRGARIAGTTELDEEILADAIQAVSMIDYEDSINRSYDLNLTPGQTYRVELKLRCSARATFALSATTCEFGSNDPTDTGPNFARWSDIVLTYQ